MKRVGFWLVKCIAYVNSITPFALLYLKSDIYCFLLYHLIRYRRKVVRQNLLLSFPEKSLSAIKTIEKGFYRNFCDLFLEGCKLIRMNPAALQKRVVFTNPEMIRGLYEKGRNVFCAMSHSGNWEWYARMMSTVSGHRDVAIYKRLSNPYFDAFIRNLRRKFNEDRMEMMETADVKKELEQRKNGKYLVLILGDQSPRGVESDYWTDFLHRDTCWYYGLEKMAKRLDYSVVYIEMNRVKRGYYEVTFQMICEDPLQTENGFIMEQYVRHTERFIQNHPDNWLWSHRRWKHSRNNQEQ
jgi:KDO2-lipid IV(A) lauroyltransferase